MSLSRLHTTRKNGEEQFHADGQPLGWNLSSFWSWSTSDLVSNATRGKLAEFIVAHALGISTERIRDEWAAYDLESTDGIRIEVKSAAYVQSWHQDKPSAIVFRTPKTRPWDADTNRLGHKPSRQAHVYVFALLHHRDKATVDPLNMSQWQFFVLPTYVLNRRKRSQHSITLRSLEALTKGSVSLNELAAAVRAAARQRA